MTNKSNFSFLPNSRYLIIFLLLFSLLLLSCKESNKDSDGDLPPPETMEIEAKFQKYFTLNFDESELKDKGKGTLVFDLSSDTDPPNDIFDLASPSAMAELSPNGEIVSLNYDNNTKKITLSFTNVLYSKDPNSSEDVVYSVIFNGSDGTKYTFKVFRVEEEKVEIFGNSVIYRYEEARSISIEKTLGFVVQHVSGAIGFYSADGHSPSPADDFGRCVDSSGADAYCSDNSVFQKEINGLKSTVTEGGNSRDYFTDGFPQIALLSYFEQTKKDTPLAQHNRGSTIESRMSNYDNILSNESDGTLGNEILAMNENLSLDKMKPSIGQVFYVGDGHPNNSVTITNNRNKVDKYVFSTPMNAKTLYLGIQKNSPDTQTSAKYTVQVGIVKPYGN